MLVLDLSAPGSGLSLVGALAEAHGELGVVVFTMYPEDGLALHHLRAGALAYLNKQRPLDELVVAVRRAAQGRQYLTDTLAELARGGGATDALPHAALSPRELEVFQHLIDGKRVSDIAYALDISISTASNHLSRVREKLGCESNGEVLLYAQRAGLLG